MADRLCKQLVAEIKRPSPSLRNPPPPPPPPPPPLPPPGKAHVSRLLQPPPPPPPPAVVAAIRTDSVSDDVVAADDDDRGTSSVHDCSDDGNQPAALSPTDIPVPPIDWDKPPRPPYDTSHLPPTPEELAAPPSSEPEQSPLPPPPLPPPPPSPVEVAPPSSEAEQAQTHAKNASPPSEPRQAQTHAQTQADKQPLSFLSVPASPPVSGSLSKSPPMPKRRSRVAMLRQQRDVAQAELDAIALWSAKRGPVPPEKPPPSHLQVSQRPPGPVAKTRLVAKPYNVVAKVQPSPGPSVKTVAKVQPSPGPPVTTNAASSPPQSESQSSVHPWTRQISERKRQRFS